MIAGGRGQRRVQIGGFSIYGTEMTFMDDESCLEIKLLGPFDVKIGSRPLPHLRTRKGQHLLAMLAIRAGREIQREWLAACLWPESDLENGYYNLRRTLANLRTAMGPVRELIS